jgi:hypothetical protein
VKLLQDKLLHGEEDMSGREVRNRAERNTKEDGR